MIHRGHLAAQKCHLKKNDVMIRAVKIITEHH